VKGEERAGLGFLEVCCGFLEVDVSQEHVSAARSFEAEIVHDFFFLLAVFDAFFVFFIEVADGFPAAEAAYWYNHYR
jgi:hypothetical protein